MEGYIKFVRLLWFFALWVAVQDPQTQTCTLSGSAVNAVTGAPLGKVEILAERVGSDEPPASTFTDAQGNFVLVGIAAGKYRLVGHRNGYLETYYGARRPRTPGTILAVEAGEQLKDLQVKLAPYGAISGTVRDTDGEPMIGAAVALYRQFYTGTGQREIHAAAELVTDDQGQYRAGDLEPGKYFVRAEANSLNDFGSRSSVDHSRNPEKTPPALIPTLYPGVTDPAAARPIELALGARLSGIDITLVRSRLYRVTVKPSAGGSAVVRDAWLYNAPPEWRYGLVLRTGARTPSGDFLFPGVPPGTYTLDVRTQVDEIRARVPLIVAGDLEGVRVAVAVPVAVEGKVVMAGGGKLDFPGTILFDGGTDGSGTADIRDNGTFTVAVYPGRYDLYVVSPGTVPPIQSIRLRGEDVYEKGVAVPGAGPLEITLEKETGAVEGVVTGDDGKPAAGATVLLVGTPRSRRDVFHSATTDQKGRYDFAEIRPGEYKLFVWDDVEPDQWFDPDYLKQFEARAEKVTIPAGDRSKADLRLK